MVALRPRLGRATAPLRSRFITTLALITASALLAACSEALRADGVACASAFECRSGACLSRPTGGAVCATRCAANTDCASGEICGRFDFRGRDDGGLPAGPSVDIVRACRAPLNTPCAAGCGLGELCAGGVCVRRCAGPSECGGRACIALACGSRRCAAPCDHLRECPEGEACDLATLDVSGHGRCISLDDAGAPGDGAVCDANP
jgi:hypothetical protein